MARLFPLHSSSLKPEQGHSRNPTENARLRPEMIRRVATQPPQLLDPNGKISWKSPAPQLDRGATSGSYTANDGARPFSAVESETTAHGQYAILFSRRRRGTPGSLTFTLTDALNRPLIPPNLQTL